MKLHQAVEAIEAGLKVRNSKGSVFWLAYDKQSRPVLMSLPPGFERPVRSAVFGSEHFDPGLTWDYVDPEDDPGAPQ